MNPAQSASARATPGDFYRARAAFLFVGAMLACVLGGPWGARADDTLDAYKANLRIQKGHYDASMDVYEPIDDKPHKCSDVFALTLDNDRLRLLPNVAPTPRRISRRVDLMGGV